MKHNDVIGSALLLLIFSILISIVGTLDAKHDRETTCHECKEIIHFKDDDYVCTSDQMFYHPECYMKHLKEEESNG